MTDVPAVTIQGLVQRVSGRLESETATTDDVVAVPAAEWDTLERLPLLELVDWMAVRVPVELGGEILVPPAGQMLVVWSWPRQVE